MVDSPSTLFVRVHNAGRSQMAAAFARELGGDAITALSAGSEPAAQLNPAVVVAMKEVGIDIASETPRLLSTDDVRARDVGIVGLLDSLGVVHA